MSTQTSHASTSGNRVGMTLLEVLVACGILILGLSGIAALLPAAGFQFGQAATEDRASVLAANARSDASSRRLPAAALSSNPALAVGFGPGLAELSSVAPAWFSNAVASTLTSRIDGTRGFWLEDDLAYQTDAPGNPINTFANGATGPREFKERVCWAGLILPGMKSDGSGAAEASAGQPATLAIASLRKAPATGRAVKLFRLSAPYTRLQQGQSPPPGVSFTVAPEDLSSEADRKQFFGPCGWVLLLPNLLPGTQRCSAPIRLLQINSSWTLPNGSSSQIVLRMPEDLLVADGPGKLLIDRYRTLDPPDTQATTGVQLFRVIGIANVVRLDQHYLTLD
jgi:hypothetical protein